ncbi:MAG: MBL fold metallo-hydrolase, partial [Halobacteriaceae archaeon]
MTVRHDGLAVTWLGYATARIAGDATVYTDPGRYGTLDGTWAERYGGADHPSGPAYDRGDGDVVVVTHDHHYDSEGVGRVADEDATVVVYEAVDADRVDRDVEPPEE